MEVGYYAPVGPSLPRVWTTRRKWLGNLVPLLFWLPPTAIGVFLVLRTGAILGPGIWLVATGQAVGWLALNFFGLWDNGRMRRDSLRNLAHRTPPPPGPVVFVGCASVTHKSILDPHQDVGFLSFGEDELEFIGEDRRMRLPRSSVTRVRFRPSVHTWLGLGWWISVEAVVEGRTVRMLLEPREKDTLLGNLFLSGWLKRLIQIWRRGVVPSAFLRHLPDPPAPAPTKTDVHPDL